ncbi:MAG: DUF4242 domain-containing protein [Aigarchaeota archaeon]|nr:DUF4242 domain-containing protein [Candidatus Pelearchaeum maunauluense]
MPLYLDVHKNVRGVNPKLLEEAHQKDLEKQGKHGVKFVRYWYHEKQGVVFCLFKAEEKEAGNKVHSESHGLVADEIY